MIQNKLKWLRRGGFTQGNCDMIPLHRETKGQSKRAPAVAKMMLIYWLAHLPAGTLSEIQRGTALPSLRHPPTSSYLLRAWCWRTDPTAVSNGNDACPVWARRRRGELPCECSRLGRWKVLKCKCISVHCCSTHPMPTSHTGHPECSIPWRGSWGNSTLGLGLLSFKMLRALPFCRHFYRCKACMHSEKGRGCPQFSPTFNLRKDPHWKCQQFAFEDIVKEVCSQR